MPFQLNPARPLRCVQGPSALARLLAVVALAMASMAGSGGLARAQTVAPVERIDAGPAAARPAANPQAAPPAVPIHAEAARMPSALARPPVPSPQSRPQRDPTEFERLATQANGGRPVWRFGAEPDGGVEPVTTDAGVGLRRVPGDYPVQVGDELLVNVWGSVEGEWRLRVDRGGRVVLPRVGPTRVEGVPAAELEALLRQRLQSVYRGFELGAAVVDVGPIRVQLTGFVERPGPRVLPGLSTISQALEQADVAPVGGSLRRARLLRAGRELAVFDLYTLLAEGRAADDRLLLGGDVIHVEAIGAQVAVLGSVNRPAVFEILPGQTVADALALAGGFSAVADGSRMELERLRDRDTAGVVTLAWPNDGALPLADGDLLRVRSQVQAQRPTQSRNKRVRIEGEVARPGDYVLSPDATLADAVATAGGTTDNAFLFGTELRRERVRVQQEANYLRALQELEAEAARLAATRGVGGGDVRAQEAALEQLITRLRAQRPEGRLVLELPADAAALPALALEDGDLVRIPPRSQSVGVFGSVFNAGSFVHEGSRTLGSYLALAGGPTAAAEADSMFVIRANGSVVAARQGGYWRGRDEFEARPALPGDTVYVPDELDRVTFVQGAKDWTQILYQLGIGLAALLTIR